MELLFDEMHATNSSNISLLDSVSMRILENILLVD